MQALLFFSVPKRLHGMVRRGWTPSSFKITDGFHHHNNSLMHYQQRLCPSATNQGVHPGEPLSSFKFGSLPGISAITLFT
jgi:hypothetical protein